jgi:hypothetical protein
MTKGTIVRFTFVPLECLVWLEHAELFAFNVFSICVLKRLDLSPRQVDFLNGKNSIKFPNLFYYQWRLQNPCIHSPVSMQYQVSGGNDEALQTGNHVRCSE